MGVTQWPEGTVAAIGSAVTPPTHRPAAPTPPPIAAPTAALAGSSTAPTDLAGADAAASDGGGDGFGVGAAIGIVAAIMLLAAVVVGVVLRKRRNTGKGVVGSASNSPAVQNPEWAGALNGWRTEVLISSR